jgi:hypothetical protein
MSDINKIEGIQQRIIANLKRSGIETIDDLWMQVGNDFNSGITKGSQQAKVGENLVTALLIAESLDQLRVKYAWLSSFRNYHRGALRRTKTFLLLIPIAVIVYVSYVLLSGIKLPQQIVVAAPHGIPAYRLVGKEDVALRSALFQSPTTFGDPAMAIGNYTLTNLSPGATVLANQVLPAALSSEIKGGYIISVPIKANSLEMIPKVGTHVSLFLASPQPDNKISPSLLIDVVLLGVERNGDSSTLVIAVHDLEKIDALMHASSIVVLEALK